MKTLFYCHLLYLAWRQTPQIIMFPPRVTRLITSSLTPRKTLDNLNFCVTSLIPGDNFTLNRGYLYENILVKKVALQVTYYERSKNQMKPKLLQVLHLLV